MNKNNVFTLSLGIINLVAALLLTIFCVPAQIPIIVNIKEEIVLLCSKWLLVVNIALPIIFSILAVVFSKKQSLSFVFKLALGIMTYENMLALTYFSVENNLTTHAVSQIPLGLSILMPIAVVGLIWALKIKRIPYKNWLGLKNKYSTETEFLWKQIHLLASDTYLKSFLVSFAITIPFIFVKFAFIGLAAILVIHIISTAYIMHESKKLHNKYLELKDHHEKHKKRMEEYDKMQQEKNKG